MKSIEDEEWKLPFDEITVFYEHLLGEGQYGKVYLGKWRTIFVALKIFDSMNRFQWKELMNEFNILTRLHHPNIVQFLGYVEEPFIIVMEYFPLGNLQQFLMEHRYLSYHHRMDLCLSIARGIYYLHHRKPTWIIHRDLKPTNLLMEYGLNVKISDFGMSKLISTKSKLHQSHVDLSSLSSIEKSGIAGTLTYMAPEMLDESQKTYNQKIDIYSFGIIMYEIFVTNRMIYEWSNKDAFIDAVKQGIHPRFPCFFPSSMKQLIMKCLDRNDKKRPSIQQIVFILESIQLGNRGNPFWKMGFYFCQTVFHQNVIIK
jgi:serine/threonine protein kinase